MKRRCGVPTFLLDLVVEAEAELGVSQGRGHDLRHAGTGEDVKLVSNVWVGFNPNPH